jgi:hypothetical protein
MSDLRCIAMTARAGDGATLTNARRENSVRVPLRNSGPTVDFGPAD